jgi:hypothetical protein
MGQVHLALFELGSLEQFLSLVTGTTHQENTAKRAEYESCGFHGCPFRPYPTGLTHCCPPGRFPI